MPLRGGNAPFLQHQDAIHAQFQRTGSRQHGVIALRLTGGHDKIISLLFGIVQQVFQLADFVAAQSNATQIVALDPHIGAQLAADILQFIPGRRKETQGHFFKSLHEILLYWLILHCCYE